VLCDISLLATLPVQEILNGFAEIVKHAAIQDAGLFAYLEEIVEKALGLAPDVMEKLVHASVMIKASIVRKDEKEKGERRKLNFGHTFGHAIEKVAGVPHGQAVSAGMAVASAISAKCGILSDSEALRITELLERFRLPAHIQLDKNEVMEAIMRDKKRSGNIIHFVLLNGLGSAIVKAVSIPELRQWVNDYCSL
jgi:3-dehydroquinate synthase